jgi:hypothetical protein
VAWRNQESKKWGESAEIGREKRGRVYDARLRRLAEWEGAEGQPPPDRGGFPEV